MLICSRKLVLISGMDVTNEWFLCDRTHCFRSFGVPLVGYAPGLLVKELTSLYRLWVYQSSLIRPIWAASSQRSIVSGRAQRRRVLVLMATWRMHPRATS